MALIFLHEKSERPKGKDGFKLKQIFYILIGVCY